MTQFQLAVRQRAKKEMSLLPVLEYRNMAEVKQILSELFGRQIWWLSKDDQRRLLTLKIWSEKYQVSVAYILNLLVPHYQLRFQKRRRADRKGMPCRVPTLVGKASEWLLQEQLKKEFPEQEQRELWAQERREEILYERELREQGDDDTVTAPRRKTLLDYKWPSAFVQSYETRINRQRQARERARTQKQKPYRGNPW